MFDRVARFVTRRYKLIMIAWIVAVLVSIPFAPQVFTILQYEETQMAPANLESEIAQKYISDHFGNVLNQSTTIIVLTDDDVLSNETKNIVYRIDNELFNASHDGRIDSIVKLDSIYNSGKLYLAGFLQGISVSYPSMVDQTNLTANAIFGLPLQFQIAYNNANETAFILYGIPDIYSQTWKSVSSGPGDVNLWDNQTYATVREMMESMSESLDPSAQRISTAWLAAFAQEWNVTSSALVISTDPVRRAQIAETDAFGPFTQSLSSYVENEELEFLGKVNSSFNQTTYNNFHELSAFSESLFSQTVDSNLANESQAERGLVQSYLDTFYNLWNSSASEPSESALQAMVGAAVSSLTSSLPTDQAQFFQSIHSTLGWSNWNDSAAINAFAITTIAAKSQAQSWLVNQLVGLGPNASIGEIMALATEIMSNSSIASFPIPFPQELINSFVSSDNTTMIISLTYTSTAAGSADGKVFVNYVRDAVRSSIQSTGIVSYVTGSDPIEKDMEGSLERDMGLIEPVTIILILVLIGLYFRSLVASSIPPLFIGLALAIAFAAVFVVGSFVLSIHYSVVTLMLTSMMGAGCDYCIFILSRYREERRNGKDKNKSVLTAVTWAGESIATSGATVIIGFGVLSMGRFSMLQSMGVSLALGVTIALLAALTLLPAALMLAGDRMFWPAKFRTWNQMENRGVGYFTHSARFAIKHAKPILIVAILVSIPATYLVYTLSTSYDFIEAMPATESRAGLDVMAADFGGGRMLPTYVALSMSSPIALGESFNSTELNAIENLSARIASLSNVKQVMGPTRPLGETINYTNLSSYPTEEAAQLKATMLRTIGNDQRSILINVVLVDEPFAKSSIESISALRQIAREVPQSDPSILAIYVGGSTASMKDVSDVVGTDFSAIELVVVVGIYIVLLVVLGSVINPLRSILTILLSISWTLALTMLVFQFYLGQPILWMLPMILLVVCLGLGMDYDVLLTTRIREEASKGLSNNDAIVHAVERTGGIITACGVIMAAAFGSMLLSQGALLREFGFALMFAILLDATVVRIYLVPAIMSLLGKWNWWAPGPLQRRNQSRKERKLGELKEVGFEVMKKT